MILAFDTSNYTTSLALVSREGKIIKDERIPLKVKKGERGLRQSDALFQHWGNLPELAERALSDVPAEQIQAVAASDRPRAVEGSYMPVFLAGIQFGRALAATLHVPFFTFSHQEGHMAAGSFETALEGQDTFLAWHLSGGTCELLRWSKGQEELLGGTLDLSFGQVIDRIGVAMGLGFPAGKALDEMALRAAEKREEEGRILAAQRKKLPKLNQFSRVTIKGLRFNLSGLETQLQRALDALGKDLKTLENEQNPDAEAAASQRRDLLVLELFTKMADCLWAVSSAAAEETGLPKVLFAGGVSSSAFLRRELVKRAEGSGITLAFGRPALSSDNAVGTALLGRDAVWP